MADPRTAPDRARIDAAIASKQTQLIAAQAAKPAVGKFDRAAQGSVAGGPEVAFHEYEGGRGAGRYVGLFVEVVYTTARGERHRMTRNVAGPGRGYDLDWHRDELPV